MFVFGGTNDSWSEAPLGEIKYTDWEDGELYSVLGGYIADTPGFSALETGQYDIILKNELQYCFREFEPYLDGCKFTDCSHTKEKGCVVIEAKIGGEISDSRFDSYCKMYDEAKQIKEWEL